MKCRENAINTQIHAAYVSFFWCLTRITPINGHVTWKVVTCSLPSDFFSPTKCDLWPRLSLAADLDDVMTAKSRYSLRPLRVEIFIKTRWPAQKHQKSENVSKKVFFGNFFRFPEFLHLQVHRLRKGGAFSVLSLGPAVLYELVWYLAKFLAPFWHAPPDISFKTYREEKNW